MREPIVTPEEESSSNPEKPAAGRGSSASAVAVPLLALGLLGAAVWLGSMPPPEPAAPGAAPQPKLQPSPQPPVDPLPSWRDAAAKRSILSFIDEVSDESGPQFVPPAERVAVFDHDGTLACEAPILNALFLVERVRGLVARRPELASEEPFASLLAGDVEFARRLGRRLLTELAAAASEGRPVDELEADARAFLATAEHPVYGVPLREVVFQPMLELLDLLRAKGFSVWLCSGSSVHFLRPLAAEWYGIDPARVIGSRLKMRLEQDEPAAGEAGRDGQPPARLIVLPEVEQFNDGPEKPVSLAGRIGRQPIFVAGNVGGGDLEMLRWSQAGPRPSLQLLVLHDDGQREVASDREAEAVLETAAEQGWQVVSMAQDWERVFARPLSKQPDDEAAVPEEAGAATGEAEEATGEAPPASDEAGAAVTPGS